MGGLDEGSAYLVSSLTKCSEFFVRLREFSRNSVTATIIWRMMRTESGPLAGVSRSLDTLLMRWG